MIMQRTSNRVVQTSTSVKSCMLFFQLTIYYYLMCEVCIKKHVHKRKSHLTHKLVILIVTVKFTRSIHKKHQSANILRISKKIKSVSKIQLIFLRIDECILYNFFFFLITTFHSKNSYSLFVWFHNLSPEHQD